MKNKQNKEKKNKQTNKKFFYSKDRKGFLLKPGSRPHTQPAPMSGRDDNEETRRLGLQCQMTTHFVKWQIYQLTQNFKNLSLNHV